MSFGIHCMNNLQPYLNFARQLAYRAVRITLSYYNNKGIQRDLRLDETPIIWGVIFYKTREFWR